MKTFILALGFLLVAFPGEAAKNGTDGDCSRLQNLSSLDIEESIESDLLSGSWTISSQDQISQNVLHFYPNGIAERMVLSSTGECLEVMMWATTVVADKAWLILEHQEGTREFLRLSQSCAGMIVENVLNHEQEVWQHNGYIPASEYAMKKAQLEGRWSSAINPFQFDDEMHGCAGSDSNLELSIEWIFEDDGMFEIEVNTGDDSRTERGVWDLTQDGKYVILRFTDGGQVASSGQSCILRLGTLNFEDLVLFHAALPESLDLQLCGQWKAVHYKSI